MTNQIDSINIDYKNALDRLTEMLTERSITENEYIVEKCALLDDLDAQINKIK